MKSGDEIVKSYVIGGCEVEVFGCWDEKTPEGKYDYYDVYVNGECINLGNVLSEIPSKEKIREMIKMRL